MEKRDGEEARRCAVVGRIACGDESALADLYHTYAQTVLTFVLARTSNRETAEEIAADVWLGCWRSAPAFRGESCVLTWLLGIAKRQVYVRMRRKLPCELPLDESVEAMVDVADGPEDSAVSGAGVEEILAALDSLPAELAETVRLAWLYELAYSDIAEVTDVPVGTVKSRVFRARHLLQEVLGRQL